MYIEGKCANKNIPKSVLKSTDKLLISLFIKSAKIIKRSIYFFKLQTNIKFSKSKSYKK